jgi:hypothetical protein
MDKGSIVTIRDRLIAAILSDCPPEDDTLPDELSAGMEAIERLADAILAACPEIAALDHAELVRSADGLIYSLDGIHPPDERLKPFLVIPTSEPESS